MPPPACIMTVTPRANHSRRRSAVQPLRTVQRPPHPTIRRPRRVLALPQDRRRGVRPTVSHQCLAQPRATGHAVSHRPALAIVPCHGAIDPAVAHQRRQRVRRRGAAIHVPVAISANRPARRRVDPVQPHYLIADPQRIAVQHGQGSGRGGDMAVRRRMRGRVGGAHEQPCGGQHRCRTAGGGKPDACGRQEVRDPHRDRPGA